MSGDKPRDIGALEGATHAPQLENLS